MISIDNDQTLIIGLVVMLILTSVLTINTFFNIMSIGYSNAILTLTVVIALISLGMSFSDGVLTPMESGLVAGIGLIMALMYNLDIVPTDELMKGAFFVLSLVFSIGAVYLLIK